MSGPGIRATSLAIVLVLAKAIGLIERDLPLSVWLPSALFWDDIAVAGAFWCVDRLLRRPMVTTWIYWAMVAWAAFNVPVTRALSSPLSANMLGAAGGPLFDSIAHYLTPVNLAVVAGLLMVAGRLPARLSRVRPSLVVAGSVVTAVVAIPGAFVTSTVDLRGLERNAVMTLARTSLPRIEARSMAGDWRASPFPSVEPIDLTVLQRAASGRHVVLVVLESTAASYLRPYGADDDPMPHLTSLAATAIQFDRAYAVYPESIKGLFATLCSRVPAFDVAAETHAGAPCEPLARSLSREGYRTGLFHSGRFAYLGMDTVVSRQGFDTLEDAGIIGGRRQSSFGVDEMSTVERMLGWVDTLAPDDRFFMTYMPTAGHHPYATDAPGPFDGRGDFSAYQNAIHDGDRALGVLVEGLRARGKDDMLWVIVGDHGEAFGQHDGNFGHTLAIYDENVRVPLLIAIPGVITKRLVVPNVSSAIDLAPTVLDLLGVPAPVAHEGESLLSPRSRMAFFFTDYSIGLLGLQDGCWKYHFEIDSGRSRLFDTCVDPGETVDQVHADAARVHVYRDRVQRWASATRAAILGQVQQVQQGQQVQQVRGTN